MLIITNQSDLDSLIDSIEKEPIIGIDTEFERQYYYFPKLSTIQLVTLNDNYLIDYLSLTKNRFSLDKFKKIIYNSECIKIFHSCRQDLEIFYNLFNEIPKSIFDTQIAANICGLGKTISYGNLCSSLLSEKIDKQYQHSNWLKRPLPKPMIEYAMNDVKYLIPLYHKLQSQLIAQNNLSLFEIEMKKALEETNFKFNPHESWKKVKFNNLLPWQLGRMKKIAALREEFAKEQNIPRKHFATDEDLITICKILPTNITQLERSNLDKNYFKSSKYIDKLFEVCNELRAKNKSN